MTVTRPTILYGLECPIGNKFVQKD